MQLTHKFLAFALTCVAISACLQTQAIAQNNPEQQAKEEVRKISLQIAPIGPVRLAQFGRVKKAPAPPKPDTQKLTPEQIALMNKPQDSASTGQESEKIDSAKAAGGSTDFSVILAPEDERPPNRLFVKNAENGFQQIICTLNSVSAPVEIPIKGESLSLFTQTPAKKAGEKPTYTKFADFKLPAGDRSVLVTITKPLKTKKWKDPIVSAHDLTQLAPGSITIINTSAEQLISCKINDQQKQLGKRRGRISFNGESNRKVARVALFSQFGQRDEDTNALIPFHDGFYPLKENRKTLFLIYSVTKKESPKGAKFIRTSIEI
ncbi:hypothetical protein [Rubritalea tangerina]|uniref:Uncharacterized protein n=1 Tax=Rubritalea tangerina TaxID=430798 RepID=A0ABW4ZCH6_9BACT